MAIFYQPVYCAAVDKAVAAGKAVHVMGLLSDGGVHSHQDHILAMLKLAAERGAQKNSTYTPFRWLRYPTAQRRSRP